MDFGYSCLKADSVPKFSGNNYYEGAWDVGQHLVETNAQNGIGLDALVQFTMNDRNNFIHGMLSSTADHSSHLKQAEVKKFALQWLGVAYEYARTGQVTATKDVTQEQAEKIFRGFIDTYEQLDESEHGMCVSLKVSSEEASRKLPRRRMRLRALGMMCHTMEDFWCPAHTCRTYHEGEGVPKNSILAFSNYKRQNGTKKPMFGYHIPFDRYAVSDSKNSGVNWREALTRGVGDYAGTEKLANVVAEGMGTPLADAHTKFNTLGMNETIECITKLLVGEGDSGDGGSPDYMQIDYGTADVYSVPQEGKYATVYYHDEVYGDTTDVDEYALASGAAVSGAAGGASTNLSAQSADDDNLDDSPTPGYIEAGDDYSRLNYGNDVFHVANVIISTSDDPDDPDNPDDPTPSSDPNSGSASTKPTSKASASSTAKTGDPLGGLGGVLSAAAVAGTALAAYSARRVANERRKAEEE